MFWQIHRNRIAYVYGVNIANEDLPIGVPSSVKALRQMPVCDTLHAWNLMVSSLFIFYKITFSFFFAVICVTVKTIYCTSHLNSCAFPFFQDLKSFFTRQKTKTKQLFQDSFKIQNPFFPTHKQKQNRKSLFWEKCNLNWLTVREPIVMRCSNITRTWNLHYMRVEELEDLNLSTETLHLCSRECYWNLKKFVIS